MKILVFLCLAIAVPFSSLSQRLVSCENRIDVVFRPIQYVGAVDAEEITKINRVIPNILKSMQQQHGFKLVNEEQAQVELTTYVKRKDSTTLSVHFLVTSLFMQNASTLISVHHSCPIDSHRQSSYEARLIGALQEKTSFEHLFTNMQYVHYNHDVRIATILIDDFVDTDTVVSERSLCLTAICQENFKEMLLEEGKRMNVYSVAESKERNFSFEDAVVVKGSLRQKDGKYYLDVTAENQEEVIYTYVIPLNKALLDKQQYRPFLYQTVRLDGVFRSLRDHYSD